MDSPDMGRADDPKTEPPRGVRHLYGRAIVTSANFFYPTVADPCLLVASYPFRDAPYATQFMPSSPA